MAESNEDAALVEAMLDVWFEAATITGDDASRLSTMRTRMTAVLGVARAHDAPTIATLTASLAEAEARAEAMHRRAQIAEGALAKANELLALADSNDGKSSRNTVRYYRKWQEAEARAGRLREALEPFVEFTKAGSFDRLPDNMPMTQGSSIAFRQVTAGDFKRARAAYMETPHGR